MNRSQRVLLFALTGVLLAAFALRLQELGAQSLWYDETVSAVLASSPALSLIAHTARDIHPPLYYLLLRWWGILSGTSEFALALFSAFWGVLLVSSTTTLARWLAGDKVALLAAALLALSPFNIWYSQEVRMYTLGATLGVWSLMALWQLLWGSRMKKRWMTLWVLSVVAGLYTLYYFAFLLLWEGLVVVLWLSRQGWPIARRQRWFTMGLIALLVWLPWLPVALRQALFPPVPPWREPLPLGRMLLESMGALTVGQSLVPLLGWEPIALVLLLLAAGLLLAWRQRRARAAIPYIGGAFCLPVAILFGTAFTSSPLYHVRYLFTYSPAFYILLSIAFTALARAAYWRFRLPGAVVASMLLLAPLLLLSAESLQRFWHDPAFAADDLRSGVEQIEQRWRHGDVVLVNAGYAYTAFHYYFDDPIALQQRLVDWQGTTQEEGLTLLMGGSVDGDPSLGWGAPQSDFYAMTEEETIMALERIADTSARLWHFRIYDTVTDPHGAIRAWLEENGQLFYDERLSGESNARVQGWYFPPEPTERPERPISINFLSPDASENWISFYGVDPLRGPAVGGSWVDFNLWLEGHDAMDPSVRLSLGLFDTSPAGRQWVPVLDEQPLGPLLSLKEMPGMQRWPVRLRLPQGIPPGNYEAHLKFYRPSDGAPLLGAGERMVTPDRAFVAVVEVGPTPVSDRPLQVGTKLEARFGPLQLLGHAIPSGPWEPGASIPVELVWRAADAPEVDLNIFLSSGALSFDDGGVTKTMGYPTSQWFKGEVVRDVHYLTVAPDVAPGEYPLFLSVGRDASTILWTQGIFRSGEALQIGQLTIEDRPRNFQPPEVETPLDIAFGDSIHLIGASLPDSNTPVAPGGEVALTLHWYALGRPPGRYKVFTHLVDPSGNLLAQRDLEPGDGRLPTNGWVRGEYVSMPYTLSIPPGIPPGAYELRVGLYDPNTGERVPVIGAGANIQERYLLLTTIPIGP